MSLPLILAAQLLVGEQLSSVTFVQDYWQLHFDGSGFTVFSEIEVTGDGFTARPGDESFRNRLCDRIATILLDVRIVDDDLAFDDGCSLAISFTPRVGPEAFTFSVRGRSDIWVA